MNVVLLSPPSRIINHYRSPLALMYLSGYLKRNNIPTKIIDVTLKNQVRNKDFFKNKSSYIKAAENEILSRIQAIETDIIGITCYTPDLQEVERLAHTIKSIKPEVKIVAGGIHPTLYPHDFLYDKSPFDFVVIGEGEVTFLELVQGIRNNNFRNVRGIGYFDKETNQAVITPQQPLVSNLDDISFPDYDDLDMEFYTTASPYAIRGVFTRSFYVSSSRGCPSSCTFCVSKKLRDFHGVKNFVRLRSPESLYNEIQDLEARFHIDSFYFIDDLFTLKRNNVFAFCNLMKQSRSRLIWGCSSKVNTVDFDLLKAMRDAGCVQIDFGVERGSDQALKLLKKGITVAQIVEAFDGCHRLGIRTFANMLVNLPEETEKDLADILGLVKVIRPHIVSFNIFTPYPGCEIYDIFCNRFCKDDFPLLVEDPAKLVFQHPEEFRFSAHSVDFTQWVSGATKKYNPAFRNMAIYTQPCYVRMLFGSKRKNNYLQQARHVMQEFIQLKFGSIKGC